MIGTGRRRFDRDQNGNAAALTRPKGARRRIKAEEEKVAEELKPAGV